MTKNKKFSDNLKINKNVLVLAERIGKKSVPQKFYKPFVQNISYFYKEKVFFIRKKQKNDKISHLLLARRLTK